MTDLVMKLPKPYRECGCHDREAGRRLLAPARGFGAKDHGVWYVQYEAPHGAHGRRRQPLLIRRFPRGRPDTFRTVRDLGLVSPGCPGESGISGGCSTVWLPAWLPSPGGAAGWQHSS